MKKKKVLQIIGYLGVGGDSTAVFNILDHIKKYNLGIEFEFLTHLDRKNKETVLKFKSILEKEGIKVHILDGDLRKLGPLMYYKQVKIILSNNNYDAIHVHTSFQGVVSIMAAKKVGIKQRISHAHTTQVQRKINKIVLNICVPICRFLINLYSTDFVGCGKDANKYLFGKNKNSKVLYNGIDIDKFDISNEKSLKEIYKKHQIDSNNIIVGHVGRFSEMKNQRFILDLAELSKSNTNIKYVLIGDGEKFEDLNKLARKKKLSNVIFTGRVDNVNEYMKTFDYFILPSIYGEGLPVVLIEAQITGCYCIAADNITKEADIGALEFISLDSKNEWLKKIQNKINKESINVDKEIFDIKNTAWKWIDIYNI